MIRTDRHPQGRRTRTRSAWRRLAFAIVLVCVCFGSALGPVYARAAEQRAELVKAAFLYHFVEFVDWPDSVARDGDPVRVGILGDDPFGPLLDEVFASPDGSGRRFEITRADDPDALAGCRMVFLGLDDDDTMRSALDALGAHPVLTVAHRSGFADHGGHINFFVEDERLRFEVNLDAAQAAGLRLSSRLLKLARIVIPAASR